MKPAVVAKLAAKFGSKYNESNILISGTHTHSGVSGFMTYFAYLVIESQKFNPISYWYVMYLNSSLFKFPLENA